MNLFFYAWCMFVGHRYPNLDQFILQPKPANVFCARCGDYMGTVKGVRFREEKS